MAFELPDLPYSHDALANLGMSTETLEFHHDLHHKAYVDNGNKLIAGTDWDGKTMERNYLRNICTQALSLKTVFLTIFHNYGTITSFGK